MKLPKHVLLALALGIGLGAALMQWLSQGSSPVLTTDRAERPAGASAPGAVISSVEGGAGLPDVTAPSPLRPVAPDAGAALVSVRVLDTRAQQVLRTEAGLLGPAPVLVLPVRDLRGAASVVLRDRAGVEATVSRVLAFDGDAGLAALDAGGLSGPGLSLAGQDHPLYLGREVALLTLSGSAHGWVDGTQVTDPSGAFPVIPVRLPGRRGGGGGVLIEPESLRLLGLPMGPLGEEGVVGATEVDAVREVLERIGRDETLTVAEFAQYYFHNTAAGLWIEIQHHMVRGDWQQAMALAASLLGLDTSYHQRAVEMLERAVTELVNSQLVAGRHAQALATLRQAEQALGENVVLLSLYANTYTALKEFDLARDYLRRAVALDPQRAPDALPRLRAVVLAQVRSLEREMAVPRIVTLLEEAVAMDPGYAVYRQYLGRYYLRQGEYAAAIQQLREAVALDASLAPGLSPLIADATVKLGLPALTEVPMQAAHGVIQVDVRVNDSPQPVRFVLDTGASQTVISRSLADRLGIAIDDQGPRVMVQTANNTVSAPVVTLRSLSVGEARVENVQALVLDTLGGTEGLLGLTYLRYFDVTIEHRLGVVGLRRK